MQIDRIDHIVITAFDLERTIDFYTRYPFGFFLKKRRVRLQGDLVVYPRLLEESVASDQFRPATGEQATANRAGPGTEIHSFREYVRGDSMRHVYWKKSASLGRWIIKQTEVDSARTVHVVVDPYKPRAVSDEEFERMVSAATTFVHQSLQRGLDVVLQLPRLAPRKGFVGLMLRLTHADCAERRFPRGPDRRIRSHPSAAADSGGCGGDGHLWRHWHRGRPLHLRHPPFGRLRQSIRRQHRRWRRRCVKSEKVL